MNEWSRCDGALASWPSGKMGFMRAFAYVHVLKVICHPLDSCYYAFNAGVRTHFPCSFFFARAALTTHDGQCVAGLKVKMWEF